MSTSLCETRTAPACTILFSLRICVCDEERIEYQGGSYHYIKHMHVGTQDERKTCKGNAPCEEILKIPMKRSHFRGSDGVHLHMDMEPEVSISHWTWAPQGYKSLPAQDWGWLTGSRLGWLYIHTDSLTWGPHACTAGTNWAVCLAPLTVT